MPSKVYTYSKARNCANYETRVHKMVCVKYWKYYLGIVFISHLIDPNGIRATINGGWKINNQRPISTVRKKLSYQKLLRVEVQRRNKLTLDTRNQKLLTSLLHNPICKYREQGTLDHRPPSHLGPRGVEYQEHTGQRTDNWSWELGNAILTLPQAEGMTDMDEV